jgi:cytolysin-activating lysine-acyltransferase
MKLQKAVLDALFLFNQSPDHRLYTLVEFNHYCLYPLIHQKARLFYKNEKPIGFVSWAWITKEEGQAFLDEKFVPDETTYSRPDVVSDDLELWGIEFIAPYGDTIKVMRGMMKHSQSVLGKRVPANWRRFNQPDIKHTKEF